MNRRTFLTDLLASGAALSTTFSVVQVLPDWREGFTRLGPVFLYESNPIRDSWFGGLFLDGGQIVFDEPADQDSVWGIPE